MMQVVLFCSSFQCLLDKSAQNDTSFGKPFLTDLFFAPVSVHTAFEASIYQSLLLLYSDNKYMLTYLNKTKGSFRHCMQPIQQEIHCILTGESCNKDPPCLGWEHPYWIVLGWRPTTSTQDKTGEDSLPSICL